MTKDKSVNYLRVYHFLLSEKGLDDTLKAFEREAKKHLKKWLKENREIKDKCSALLKDIGTSIVDFDNSQSNNSLLKKEEENEIKKKNDSKSSINSSSSIMKNEDIQKSQSISMSSLSLPGYNPPKFVREGESRENQKETNRIDCNFQTKKIVFNSEDEDENNENEEIVKKVNEKKREINDKEEKKQKQKKIKIDDSVIEHQEEKAFKKRGKDQEKGKIGKIENENSYRLQNNYALNKPFQRVDPQKVEFDNENLKSNHFLDKKGAIGSYGEKAFRDLAPTRGKEFRQEKNKKKKGTYKGGKITTQINSIKFNDSDDESGQ